MAPRRRTAVDGLVLDWLQTPGHVLRALAESLEALGRFPATLERTMRETNALIADARAQLALLGDQIGRMMEQLDTMATVTDRLVDGARSISQVASEAQRQMAASTEQLAATNRSLEQIVRLTEPLDRLGKRLADRFSRVTGRDDVS
jgi:methyl-accepting chemotaxis protein